MDRGSNPDDQRPPSRAAQQRRNKALDAVPPPPESLAAPACRARARRGIPAMTDPLPLSISTDVDLQAWPAVVLSAAVRLALLLADCLNALGPKESGRKADSAWGLLTAHCASVSGQGELAKGRRTLRQALPSAVSGSNEQFAGSACRVPCPRIPGWRRRERAFPAH